MPKTRDYSNTIELDSPPDAVFRAITEGPEIEKWLCPEARVENGRIFVSWGEGMGAESKITVLERPRRFRHEFGVNGDTKEALWVDWSIEARAGGGSTLRMVHSGFSTDAKWDEEFEAHARGWALMAKNLRHYLERHANEETGHVPFVVMTSLERGAAYAALFEDGVLGDLRGKRAGDRAIVAGFEVTLEVATARDVAATTLDDTLVRVSFEGKSSTMVYGYVIAYGANAAAAAKSLAGRLSETARTALPARAPSSASAASSAH
jgi:uncharacterized protein YndB with AHSA1/START domain